MNKKLGVAFGLIAIIIIGACLGTSSKEETTTGPVENPTMKFGVLSVEDVLPYIVAVDEGLYVAEGVDVEIVAFSSALERDSALVAGELDGVFNDPIGTALLKEGGTDVVVVSLSLGKTPDEGVFALLASPESDISSAQDLKGKEIAISSSTIIEYVTDKMLEENGLSTEDVSKIEVKKIPVRLELLLQNKVEAAVLPEPLPSLAISKGAKLIISDADLPSGRSISQTVLIFRKEFARENPDAIKAFLRANKRAAETINSDPAGYRELFLKTARVPDTIASSYSMPIYPNPQLPDKEEFEEAMHWMVSKGLLKEAISYEDIADASFLE